MESPIKIDMVLPSTSHTINNNYISNAEFYAKPFTCSLCNIKVYSYALLQRHLDGKKHKTRFEKQGKTFFCEICNVHANSEKQLNIHLQSNRHKSCMTKSETAESRACKNAWAIVLGIGWVFINFLILFRLFL